MNQGENARLWEKATDFGVELTSRHVDLLNIYLEELIEWNLKINLTGLSTRGRMINELFIDSLIPAPFIPEKGRFLDVGSGAGFPGLPIKIYRSNLNTHLMEIRAKRVSFLKQVIRQLKLSNITVISGRIEKNPETLFAQGYDIITARALAGLDKVIEWCAPLLSNNGLIVGFLGSDSDQQLAKSRGVMEYHSLTICNTISYILPGKQSTRTIVMLKKSSVSPYE